MTSVTKLQALWRRGWIEIPEVMASSGLAIFGVGLAIGGYLQQKYTHGFNHKYVGRLIVMRSDDPRVSKIQNYSPLDKFANFYTR